MNYFICESGDVVIPFSKVVFIKKMLQGYWICTSADKHFSIEHDDYERYMEWLNNE